MLLGASRADRTVRLTVGSRRMESSSRTIGSGGSQPNRSRHSASPSNSVRVLAARGVPCDLYFGVQAAAAAAEAPRRPTIEAHAWLRCGEFVVTGEAEAAAFQPIAVYRFNPALGGSAPG